MEPEKYFLTLEPNAYKRKQLIDTIRHIVGPRTDMASLVIIQGPSKSGKTTLIDLLMRLVGIQSVTLDRTDIVRTWRSYEINKIYPLRFVFIPSLRDEDIETLPLLSNQPEPVLVGENWHNPKFRYLMERDEEINVPAHIRHHILKISLRCSFDTPIPKVNVDKLREYLDL